MKIIEALAALNIQFHNGNAIKVPQIIGLKDDENVIFRYILSIKNVNNLSILHEGHPSNIIFTNNIPNSLLSVGDVNSLPFHTTPYTSMVMFYCDNFQDHILNSKDSTGSYIVHKIKNSNICRALIERDIRYISRSSERNIVDSIFFKQNDSGDYAFFGKHSVGVQRLILEHLFKQFGNNFFYLEGLNLNNESIFFFIDDITVFNFLMSLPNHRLIHGTPSDIPNDTFKKLIFKPNNNNETCLFSVKDEIVLRALCDQFLNFCDKGIFPPGCELTREMINSIGQDYTWVSGLPPKFTEFINYVNKDYLNLCVGSAINADTIDSYFFLQSIGVAQATKENGVPVFPMECLLKNKGEELAELLTKLTAEDAIALSNYMLDLYRKSRIAREKAKKEVIVEEIID